MGHPTPLNQNPISIRAVPNPPRPTFWIYSRDFAYADSTPIVVVPTRVVAADITSASAKMFAEYVPPPILTRLNGKRVGESNGCTINQYFLKT
jgi:hypothetical protein